MSFDTSTATTTFYSAREVAAKLRVSHGHIWNLIRRQEIGCFNFFGRTLISDEQIQEFLKRTNRPAKVAA